MIISFLFTIILFFVCSERSETLEKNIALTVFNDSFLFDLKKDLVKCEISKHFKKTMHVLRKIKENIQSLLDRANHLELKFLENLFYKIKKKQEKFKEISKRTLEEGFLSSRYLLAQNFLLSHLLIRVHL
jgi:hypothetical protein